MAPAGPLKVFLDDDTEHRRPPAEDWVHVTTAPAAIALLETGWVTDLSLDHDVGDAPGVGTGYDVVLFLEEQLKLLGRDLAPTRSIAVHSANPAVRGKMRQGIEQVTRLPRVLGAKLRWEAPETPW